MIAIKLKRIGKRHQPAYRLVVNEKRSKASGGTFIEDLGWMNPITKQHQINAERVHYWMKNGAQPTTTVRNLLIRVHAIKGIKTPVRIRSKKEAASAK